MSSDSMHFDLKTYILVQFVVFGTLGISIIFIGTIVSALQALKPVCYPDDAISNNCQCSLLQYTIHRLLQKLGIVKKGAGDTNESPQSTLNGYVVSSFAAAMLFGYVLSMTVMILMVFIDKLILKVSNTYEPGMTCYVASDNCTINCSQTFSSIKDMYSMHLNGTPVTCYKYQFDVVSALVAAGGLISVAHVTIHLLILVLHCMVRKCLPCYLCALPIIIALGIIVAWIVIDRITCGQLIFNTIYSHTSLLKIKCTIFFTGIVSAAMAMMFIPEPQTLDGTGEHTRLVDHSQDSTTYSTRTN